MTVSRLLKAMSIWLSFRDDPQHRDLRRWLGAFVRRPEQGNVEGVVVAAAKRLGNRLRSLDGPFDFVAEYAVPLTNEVISTILGACQADYRKFSKWAHGLKPLVHSDPMDMDRFVRAAAIFGDILDYVRHEMRRSQAPGTMLNELAHTPDLDDFERAALVAEWIFGGNETTASAISSAAILLQGHTLTDDVSIHRAAEEVLRFEPPLKSTMRVAREAHELGSREVEAGQRVLVLIAAANRDEDIFDDAATFDPRRATNPHLSFGFGGHYCLGSELARLELREALSALQDTDVLRSLQVHEVEWARSMVARSPTRLIVSVA